MTKKELSNLYHINQKIERLQDQIADLRDKAQKVTSASSGMPRGSVSVDYKTELIYYCQLLENSLKESIIEKQRLEAYISTIDDVFMQNILAYRFVDNRSWKEIAIKVGGNNTSDNLRIKVQRFIKK